MYKSPIELFTAEMITERTKHQEEQIMRAVQGVGVNVDKKELEKALIYDRQQYQKGYADGIRDVIEKMKARSHYDLYAYGVAYTDEFLDSVLAEMVGDAE